MTQTNPFLAFIEGQPRQAFFGLSDPATGAFRPGAPPDETEFTRASFADIFNDFQGFLGRQAQAGVAPTGNFTDFIRQNVNFGERFRERPGGVAERQASRAQFAPRTRFIR